MGVRLLATRWGLPRTTLRRGASLRWDTLLDGGDGEATVKTPTDQRVDGEMEVAWPPLTWHL